MSSRMRVPPMNSFNWSSTDASSSNDSFYRESFFKVSVEFFQWVPLVGVPWMKVTHMRVLP